MKKNYFKLLLIMSLMILICVFNIFVAKIFTESNIFYIVFWIAIFTLSFLLMGKDKNRNIYGLDVIQIVFIFCIVYLVATNIFGFFFGFIRSPYSRDFIRILENITPVIFVIVFQELVRYQFVSKGKDNNILILLLNLVFITLDITLALQWFKFPDSMSIFEFIGIICFKSITQNLLLTYISSKVGYKTTIMYRLIFELTIFILPIHPDLGIYLESLLNLVFPTLLFLKLNTFFAGFKMVPRKARITKLKRFLLLTPSIGMIVITFILISGLFKYYFMAIVSNSMYPVIHRGDAVIVEKLDSQEIDLLEVGTTIAFYYENRVITHRIIEINDENRVKIFYTQGDNNDNPDNWEVTPEMIKGKVSFKIPWIGFPSVWLYELMK